MLYFLPVPRTIQHLSEVARLRSLGSKHTLILLFFFFAMTRLCTQAVGSVAFIMTPSVSIR